MYINFKLRILQGQNTVVADESILHISLTFLVKEICEYFFFSFSISGSTLDVQRLTYSVLRQVLLVGNKIDLLGARKVTSDQGKAFADSNKLNYVETSALQSTNVETSFELLVSNVYYKTIAQKNGQKEQAKFVYGQQGGVYLDNESAPKKLTIKCCSSFE